jgi:cytochrome P450 family 4
VAIAVYTVHRDPFVYPEPNVFKPERFLPENSKERDPYAWIPFSVGPRNCLAAKFAMMEMKTVLCNLLRRYKVESVGSMDKWVLHTNITLKLDGGWNVKLNPRKS